MKLPGAAIIATGIPSVVRDVEADPAYAPFLAHYHDAKIRGMILLPLRSGVGGAPIGALVDGGTADAELFGVLGLYHPERIDPSEDVIELLALLAARLSLTLINFRLFRERELFKQQAVLERSQQVVGTLTAGIAHDLNNVLGAVLAAIQLVPKLDAAQRDELLEQLRGSVEHAAQLTRSLLDVSRVSRRDREDLTCDLVSSAHRAVEMVRATASPDTVIEVDARERAVWAAIDPLALARILLNLMLNSVEAIGSRPDGRIVLHIRDAGERVMIEVDDNGPGIAPEHEERIFEPFLSFGKPSGAGVGLTAARGLAERAGGALSLRHRPGPGAVFDVWLPRAAPKTIATTSGIARRPGLATTGSLDKTGARASVLLAEDEPVQRRMFADALRAAGFEVAEASTGTEASALVGERLFDVLVLDQRMPGMSGMGVLARARHLGHTTPALMISGFAIDPRTAHTLENVTIVSKPITADALVARVEALVTMADAAVAAYA
jgi:signal transduction histidine kinase/CheY-like chemotaxis protein